MVRGQCVALPPSTFLCSLYINVYHVAVKRTQSNLLNRRQGQERKRYIERQSRRRRDAVGRHTHTHTHTKGEKDGLCIVYTHNMYETS